MSDMFLTAFKANQNAAVVPQFFMHEGQECVRVLLGGNSRYSPVFRAKDFYDRDEFGADVTYADRWPDQYRQFKEGTHQTASGTPLEQAPFLNESRIRDLRALKVFTVEGLAEFDDRYIARLGGNGYNLKQMAQEFLTTNRSGPDVSAVAHENQQLKSMMETMQAQIAALQGNSNGPSDEQMKDEIAALTGSRPRGNPSSDTLRRMLSELKSEQAA